MAAKTVLITGANRGIGLSFVEHYTKQGWRVIATARNVDSADKLKSLSPWKLIQLDTADESSVDQAAAALASVPIDLLINNAGILSDADLTTTTKNDLMRHFEVNVTGPFLMTRAFLPNLKLVVTAKGSAFVAQVTSRMGCISDNSSGGYYGYRSSKTALNMITKSLSVDLKGDSIGCLLLHPGYVATDMTGNTGNITPTESVAGMTKILDTATLADSGKLFHCEGHELPW